MSLRLNPQYEKMLPTMSQEEFEQLKESIRTEGQHYPIIVSESLEVLDGHHRFRACRELDIEPDFEVKHFEDKLLEKKFVIEANLRRRHLNNFQLVELAVPLLEIEKAIAKKQKTSNITSKDDSPSADLVSDDSFSEFEPKGKTTAAVAKKAGVSTRTLEKGKKIIEKASEDDKQKLREGKTSISKIYREIAPPKPTQKTSTKPETSMSDTEILHNKDALAAILKNILEQNISCPECGNKIFQCSQCRKTLKELVKSEEQPKTVEPSSHEQPQKTKDTESTEDEELPLDDDEGFKDEFF